MKSKYIVLSLSIAILTTAFTNCSGVNFSKGSAKDVVTGQGSPTDPPITTGGGTGNPGPPCTTVNNNYTQNIRIVFMVDDSGSTFGRSGTDPKYIYRGASVNNFLSQYGSKPNFTYAYGEFDDQNDSTFFNILSGKLDLSVTSNVFGNAANMKTALSVYEDPNTDHGGQTYYDAAFNRMTSVINADPVVSGGFGSAYAVLFMSDGAPSMDNNTTLDHAGLNALVTGMINAASAKGKIVKLNTIYFGPETGIVDSTPNPPVTADQAIGNLQYMAQVGGGNFLDTNKITPGSTFDIPSVIQLPGQDCSPQ